MTLKLIISFTGPNAISVSISPENSYVLVGTAAKRMFFFSANQMVGQVYKMVKQKAGESSMRVCSLLCQSSMRVCLLLCDCIAHAFSLTVIYFSYLFGGAFSTPPYFFNLILNSRVFYFFFSSS